MNELERLGVLVVVYLISAAISSSFIWLKREDLSKNRELVFYPVINTLMASMIVIITVINL